MESLRIKTANANYTITIGSGLTSKIGELLPVSYARGSKAAVVTDSNVSRFYGKRIEEILGAAGYKPAVIEIPAGEASKSLAQLACIYDGLLDAGMTRSDFIVALGGGVVGDIAGFTASTFMRGVGFVQLPTTLLAQVDSSVGGKVAVNHLRGKNLIGAFFQPGAVIADTDTLASLPDAVFADGMAEVIKYAFIRDPEMIALLEGLDGRAGFMDAADKIIARCCRIKAEIVEHDEFDTGERMILNFGHTLGHAIENSAGYGTYSHGQAVAIGMYSAAKRGEEIGVTAPGSAGRLRALLERFGLPWRNDAVDRQALLPAIGRDKKKAGAAMRIVMLKKPGEAAIMSLSPEEAADMLVSS